MPPPRGLFISIDGPSGIGKSTTIRHVGQRLAAAGIAHHLTAEPTSGEIGVLARAVNRYDGPTLACLYAADRYHHLAEIIRPGVAAGQIVITDRYVPSGLVMQRLDGLTLTYLRHLNAHADPPDLAVILTGDPARVAGRLHARGTHNRYQDQADSTATEIRHYAEAADALSACTTVLRLDTTNLDPATVAATIHDRIDQLRAAPTGATIRLGGQP